MSSNAQAVSEKLLFTLPEAADVLRISVRHLYNLIYSEDVCVTRLGARVFVSRSELLRIVGQNSK
jgi:Helix-turn-helix domain